VRWSVIITNEIKITYKGIGKEEGQRGVGREQYERKPWLFGRHGEKLNNRAKTV
jgi:hypothetical protein